MQKRTLALIGLVCVIVFVILLAVFPGGPGLSAASPPDTIVIGQPALEQSALIYLAQEKGFFAKNNLNVTIIDSYPNGVIPVADLIDGKVDLAISAEYPVVSAITRGANITVICVIDRYQNEKILARKDRGIAAVGDLKGKRIGYPDGTIVEFFLGRFLEIHGMHPSDVTLVPLDPQAATDALADGTVDAVAYFQPHVAAMEDRFGDTVVIWQLQSHQPLYGVVTARSGWIAEHPDRVKKFLRALADAEQYAANNPEEFYAIVKKRLGLNDAYARDIWPDHQFGLTLDQSLLLAMDDQARWLAQNNRTKTTGMPNFLNHLDIKNLGEIKKNAVSIIGTR